MAWSAVEISSQGFGRMGGTSVSGLVHFCTVPAASLTVRVKAASERDAESLVLVQHGVETRQEMTLDLIADAAPPSRVTCVLQLGQGDSPVGCRQACGVYHAHQDVKAWSGWPCVRES